MLDRLFGYKVHDFLHVLGMSLLAFGLPMNKVLMSIGAIWGVSNLVLEGDYKTYWERIKSNRTFLWLLAICALHLIGFLWTSDFSFALHDIRVKLPLLVIPLALVARPITNRTYVHYILFAFLTGLFITSFINFGLYFQWFGEREYLDIREMSRFGSHIRYGLLIALGAGVSFYFLLETKLIRWLWPILILWFSIYTFYSQVLSGVLALIAVYGVLILYKSFRFKAWLGYVLVGIILLTFAIIPLLLKPTTHPKIERETLPVFTAEGNPYMHDVDSKVYENNEPVHLFVCHEELDREWKKVSELPLDGRDLKNQPIKSTLLRYMTSKGLHKDAEGFQQLTPEDIRLIEIGVGSIHLSEKGLQARLAGLKYQLQYNHDPNGHSLLQRFESWKTGWHIIQDNWLLGVGTGDIAIAFENYYQKENSPLLPENRLRTHNMYLTMWITFGIFGLIVFLGLLIQYFRFNWKNNELIPILFLGLICVSFLVEDTIETQMGVTLFGLFTGLFMQKIQPLKGQN